MRDFGQVTRLLVFLLGESIVLLLGWVWFLVRGFNTLHKGELHSSPQVT